MATTSKGVAVTVPGSTNTKGAWTQLVASTSAAFSALLITAQGNGDTSFTGANALVDIGIGGSGSETVLISDIHLIVAASETFISTVPMTYGVAIPSGTRISARWACSSAPRCSAP
jgi:hypothetical protein